MRDNNLFRLSADCAFPAEDIDDAFLLLARHFLTVALGENSSLLDLGDISIRPVEAQVVSSSTLCGKEGKSDAITRLTGKIDVIRDFVDVAARVAKSFVHMCESGDWDEADAQLLAMELVDAKRKYAETIEELKIVDQTTLE